MTIPTHRYPLTVALLAAYRAATPDAGEDYYLRLHVSAQYVGDLDRWRSGSPDKPHWHPDVTIPSIFL